MRAVENPLRFKISKLSVTQTLKSSVLSTSKFASAQTPPVVNRTVVKYSVLSGNAIGNNRSTLKLYKTEIFSRNYLFQQEGRYKGNTLRTHAGGVWLNGYSDHLPVIVYLVKEAE